MSTDFFSQPWWLDAVAPGHWGEAVVEGDGNRRAELRYTHWRERFGFVRVGVGPLSARMGPTFFLEEGKLATRLSRENQLTAELVAMLPRYDYLSLMFPARIVNGLPFHWLGFQQTTRYSYVIEPNGNDRIFAEMSEEARRAIRKAAKSLTVIDGEASALMPLVRSTLARSRARLRYDESQLAAGLAAGRARECASLRLAVGADGSRHAGALFVWDDERVYYLVGGSDATHRGSGAASLVLWDGIQLASSLGLRFDFEGSMIEPIEKFFRGFGGSPEPYLHITNYSRRLAAAISARDALAALRGNRPSDRARRGSPSDPGAGPAS